MKAYWIFSTLILALLFSGCQTLDPDGPARAQMNAAISQEAPGNYFIGRRMYKKDYKVWGWIREPQRPWSKAKLVMLNEQKKLAPDRESGKLGTDNGFEYRLEGYFSGDMVYEPSSNGFYPEFVLTGYELRSMNPVNIYQEKRQNDPAVRLLSTPR